MKSFTAILAIFPTLSAVADAAPSTRAAWPSMPASDIKSYSLWGWGPRESSAGNVNMVILDADLESSATIKKLKSEGKKVVCYISAGTLENWRSDKAAFTSSVDLAKKYKGFGGTETWFDITDWESLKGPMGDRISNAASKGCDGIEFDNVDCYNNMCVPGASYDTLRAKQIEYVMWLAGTAHEKGMASGMKNAVELIDSLIGVMDFAVNEQCQEYGNPKGSECAAYNKFASQNKLVVGVEYSSNGGKACQVAKQYKMLTKYRDGSTWKNCF